MTENPPQDQAVELIKTPPLPSATPKLPSQKLLLADPKPNHRLTAGSSDSALSSDSSSDRLLKKTRDLPNLSDCHGCGSHINHTNPQDRLQTLGSFWRIVLLCRKCIKRVGSSQCCSYCFSEAGQECYKCRSCERKIHKDCVVRYRTLSPWCYCSSELEFSVCVDCWMPKLLKSSVRVYKRNRTRQGVAGGSKDHAVNGNSKSLVNVSSDAQKKTVVSTKAKDNALRKAVVAKRALELANGALELVAKKTKNVAGNPSESNVSKVIDDAELAIQLHRAMNSSPRISRSSCLLSSACLTTPKNLDFNGNSFGSLSGISQVTIENGSSAMEICPSKLNANTDAPVSKLSVYVRRSGNGRRSFFLRSSANTKYTVYVRRACRDRPSRLDYVKRLGLVYTRKRYKNKENREKGAVIDGKCENVDGNNMIIESQTSSKPDALQHESHCNNIGDHNKLNCNGNNGALHDGKCNQTPNRYMLKYSKRSVGLKACKRENTCDGYNDGSKAKAEGMSLNGSQECKALSGASLQVSAVAMEASACVASHQKTPPELKSYRRQKMTRN